MSGKARQRQRRLVARWSGGTVAQRQRRRGTRQACSLQLAGGGAAPLPAGRFCTAHVLQLASSGQRLEEARKARRATVGGCLLSSLVHSPSFSSLRSTRPGTLFSFLRSASLVHALSLLLIPFHLSHALSHLHSLHPPARPLHSFAPRPHAGTHALPVPLVLVRPSCLAVSLSRRWPACDTHLSTAARS